MAKQYQYYEDTAFATGDSPATHDVQGDFGRIVSNGFIHNYGAGVLTFAISDDAGVTYGAEVRLPAGATHTFNNATSSKLKISRIRVTWVTDTSYRIFVN